MGHAMASLIALAVPVFFVAFALVAFLINTLRGVRAERADREKIEHAPKPPGRPLPRKLQDQKKH